MRRVFIVAVCLIILFSVGTVILFREGSQVFGPGYDPSSDRDLMKLLAIADRSRPLREAVERFRNEHGNYPSAVTNLFPSYLQPANAPKGFYEKDWAGWEYHNESTNQYELFFQLEWDGGLWFKHTGGGTNIWTWSTSNKAVDLSQKIEGR